MLNSAVDVVYDHPSKTFLGVRFVLLGFDPINKDKVRSKLVNGGGIDVGQYGPNCTHLIVDNIALDDPVCVAARNDGKTLVTGLWVDHSFDVGMPVDPTSIMYRPLRDKNGIPGAKSLMVCLTGYQRQDRDDIMTMVGLMGANFSKPLVANKVTHLVCYKFEGEKYELAKKMKKIKLVNHKWLEDCLKAWEILPEANYDKSGYELETLEAEAKDSEDEAEDQIGERKITASPLTSRTIAEKSDQSPKLKQEISPNQLHSSASKRDLNLSSFSLEIRINNPEVLDSRDSVVLGDFHSAEQSKTHERTPNSVKAGNEPSSASRTAKRSPPPLDSAKLTAMSYSRKTPRRTATASPISGEMAANDMDMDKDILVVSDGFHTDARPEKRKLDSSYGSTKSLKMAENLSPEKSVQNAVIEPVKNSLIDTLTPPSCRKNLLVSDMGVAEIVTSDLRKDFNGGQASDINLDMHKGENSDSYTKPLKKKMIGKSILGSKSNIGKVDSGNKKGSIFLNKSASPAVVDLDMGDKITSFDDETEAPDDRDANGFAVAPPLEKLGEEAEPEHKEDFGSELTEGQKHLSMTTDNNSLPDREGGESDTGKIEKKTEKDEYVEDGGKNGIECEKAVDLKETEPIVSTSIEISGKEKGNRGKKHVSVNPKRNNLLSVKKLLNPKAGFDHEGKENEMEKNKTQTERKECVEIFEGGEREIESEKPNDVKKSELGVSTSMEINGKEKTPQRKTKGNSLPALQTQTEKEECAQDGKDRDAVTTDGGKIVISSEKATEPVDSTSTEINRRKKLTPNKPKKNFLPPGRKIQTEKEERPQDGVDRDVVSTDRGKIVISSEKTAEPVDSISTEITQREKHIPNKTKKNSLPVVEKLTNPKMGGKIGKKKGDKSERENNESVKGENPVEMEKENQPIDNEEKNKGKKLASKSNRAQTKGGKTVKDATEIRKAKAEAVWFILSGHRLQRKEFQQVIKRLKGRVCRDSHHWSYQATHFIAPDPIRRTEKFFAAAASGRWILKTDYLTACNQAGRFLPEEPYEWHKNGLSEDGAINMEAPRKWRLVKERTGHGAFYGMRIVVYGECIAPPLDTLKRAVKAGDGTILATSPPYTRFLESGIDFAVVSPGMPRVDMWVQEFLQHEIPCVLADYLVEYVCKPGYPLDKNVQYNTHSFAEKSFKNLQNRMEEIVEDQTPPQEEEEGEGKSDLTCRVCGSRERGEVMMICGDESGSVGCGVGTHIDCCEPPLDGVPEDDWFCPDCKNKVSSCNNNNGKKPRKKIAKRMK